MQESLFGNWLFQERYDEHTISSRISNCRRVETYENDLDIHYQVDNGKALISKLAYSKDDKRCQRKPKHDIPVNGNIYTGTATFRTAVNLYFRFKDETSSRKMTAGTTTVIRIKGIRTETKCNNNQNSQRRPYSTIIQNTSELCPPANRIKEFEKDICEILAKLCHHIHPKIIEYIQEVNANQYSEFETLFKNKIEIKHYLFQGSACVFPGVRRYVSRHGKKSKYNDKYRAIVDDNTFPRHLRCYLVNSKIYSSTNWKKTGLNEFEMAHIFTHKEDELEFEMNFFNECDSNLFPYGDFTCGCNVVLLPKGTARPTDSSETIKSIFYRRYIELYGEEPLNGRRGFHYKKVPGWYSELEWNAPFLPDSWEVKTNALLKYRTKRIKHILSRATV